MNKSYLAILLFAALFASCENGDGEQKKQISQLSITANIDQVTRASKTSFVAGDEIGVFLLNSEGNSYTSSGSTNNKATLSSSWTMEKGVNLTDESGTVYAYSPYSSQVTDLKQIPVRSSSQTDLLYARPIIVDATNPVATLQFKHALSLVKFMIKKDGYIGNGHITEVNLKGVGLTGTVDAKSGDITTLTTGNEKYEGTFYLDGSTPLVIGIIAFPQSVSATAATMMIDGVNYSYKLVPSKWEAGKETTYTLKIDPTTQSLITIGSATIDSWGTGGSYEGNLVSGGIDISTEI